MTIKHIKWKQNIPNDHKIDQHLPLQDPKKFTQIGILFLKYTIWQPWSAEASFLK
jgi:hypothetical protein